LRKSESIPVEHWARKVSVQSIGFYYLPFSLMLIPLIILTLISWAGLVLYFFQKINQTILTLLIGLWAGSMLSVSLAHILAEALEQTDLAIYAFIAWFLIIYIIEELLTPHQHDVSHGNHAHEDPHEHYDHVAVISWIAIFCHTLFDGLGIRAGMLLSEVVGYTILFGVAIHQIPVSLSLAAIFRESKFKRFAQVLFLIAFAFAAPLGYIISDFFLGGVDELVVGLAAAFAWGSLLYVATVDLIPIIHSQWRWKIGTVISFIIGIIGMTAVKWFE
jgi:zinc transporter, ZIP family